MRKRRRRKGSRECSLGKSWLGATAAPCPLSAPAVHAEYSNHKKLLVNDTSPLDVVTKTEDFGSCVQRIFVWAKIGLQFPIKASFQMLVVCLQDSRQLTAGATVKRDRSLFT